jgi:SAM-dependent methyltransferase
MHAAVMFRRRVFKTLRYDVSLKAAEDYDVYLRIAREYPIVSHTKQIAVYNRHDANMSGNYPMMLDYTLKVLNQQNEVLRNETERSFMRQGQKFWIDHYCLNIYVNLGRDIKQDPAKRKAQLNTLQKYHKALYYKYLLLKPLLPFKRQLLKGNNNLILKTLSTAGFNKNFIPSAGRISMGDLGRVTPFSTNFGYERGGPVDRYYIENFLVGNSSRIKGRVLEIGDNDYTLKFGETRVTQSDILHVNSENSKATFIGDLSNAPSLPSDAFDCIVLTQTLQFIYDYQGALQTCYRILKPGGSLLMTVPGISHIDQGEWRKLWMYSFSESVITKALSEIFPVEKIEVETYGNVLVASAFLFGLGLPELKKEQLDHNDPHYQVIITSVAVKP